MWQPARGQRLSKRTVLRAVGFAAILGAAPASAITYYVRTSGNDIQDGLTPETALASIRLAGTLLLEPGDRVVVGPGIYREGNIRSFGSGTPDAPIVFFADTTGALTQDPPGPVEIFPPNTSSATTGFLVLGRHDILIEGFVVEGAADAGIQVRPTAETEVDSTRITLRNNALRGGHQRGIHVIAVGDVTATDNTAARNRGTGLAFLGGLGGPVRPLVRGNRVERNRVGIGLTRTSGAVIEENELVSNRGGLGSVESAGLTIRGNQIVETSDHAIKVSGATDLVIESNVIGLGARISARGTVDFSDNRFLNVNVSFILSFFDETTFVLRGNQLPITTVSGAAQLDAEGNTGRRFVARVRSVRAVDNQFTAPLFATAEEGIELQRNQARQLVANGGETVVDDNDFAGSAVIVADSATVADNTAASLAVFRRQVDGSTPPLGGGPFLVERNTTEGALRFGDEVAPIPDGVIRDNSVGGLLNTYTKGALSVRRNQAKGISCLFPLPDSELRLTGNETRRSTQAGITVIGAETALIENNVSAENEDSGLAARRVGALTVSRNTFLGNAQGGVSVLVPFAGDCDGNLRVTIDELITATGVVLGERRLRDCPAADFDGDEQATIEELVLAVASSLGVAEPVLSGGRVEIRSNQVEDNARFGINITAEGPVLALSNRVVGNAGVGIAVYSRGLRDEVEIAGNVLGAGGAEGLVIEGIAGAQARSNVIFSNGEAGILLRDAPDASVINNLVYANANDGIAVGLGTSHPAENATLRNNTLYANAGWGVTIGSGEGEPSTGAEIFDNIFDRNGDGGIAAQLESLPGLTIGFNLNNDGYSNDVVPSVTDFMADPRFVAPAGGDGVLGGEGFEDDDFHLRADPPPSAAIDAGSATAAELGITGSAVAGRTTDEGIVDLGYHYGAKGDEDER